MFVNEREREDIKVKQKGIDLCVREREGFNTEVDWSILFVIASVEFDCC